MNLLDKIKIRYLMEMAIELLGRVTIFSAVMIFVIHYVETTIIQGISILVALALWALLPLINYISAMLSERKARRDVMKGWKPNNC